MEYVTLGGFENDLEHKVVVVKHPKRKFYLLYFTNAAHFLLTIIIAIAFAVVIYNIVVFRDNVDIQHQLQQIDKITVQVDDFMKQNKQFFNETEGFVHRFEHILDKVCQYDPKLCD
jgi:hypothetical protein